MGCLTCILFWIVIVLVVLKVYLKLSIGWCRSNVCLVGKTVIITGANTGIGYETAEDLAKRGARVILACRDSSRGKDAVERVTKATDNQKVEFKQLDLSSFKSVREFAADINKNEERLDILVNNAGVGSHGREKSEDGLLLLMQANYFGHFLLTNLLLDLLKKTKNARIVNVSSLAAKSCKQFDVHNLNAFPENVRAKGIALYARSKLCNILFTIELAEKLQGTSVTTYSLHPGAVLTDIFKTMPPIMKFCVEGVIKCFFKNSLEGAQTTIYCSVAKGIESMSGQHFVDCAKVKRYKTAEDPELPKKLWRVSEGIVKISQ